jgi:hypothetical protein
MQVALTLGLDMWKDFLLSEANEDIFVIEDDGWRMTDSTTLLD